MTVGGFMRTTLREFPWDEYQKAKEYIKQAASKHRPSRVTYLDAYGNILVQWEYKKLKPRPYETNPRKNK